MQEDILGFEPGGKAIDAAFLALGRYKGKGSGILEVNSQGEVVLGGTHQPGLCMTAFRYMAASHVAMSWGKVNEQLYDDILKEETLP